LDEVEFFETFDDHGRSLGLVPRHEVHRRGLWHRASNVLLFDGSGALYLQRRAAGKDVWPNAWDLSVGEHLQPGESFEQAAHRGLAEELGVHDVALTALGGIVEGCIEIPEMNVYDRELQQSFRGVYDGTVVVDSREVAAVRRLTIDALIREIEATPDAFTPWLRARLGTLSSLVP
jgi:isopentenyldiphosphate isomerase